jgi:dCMP deaminase
MRPSITEYYTSMLKLVASRATCPRRQVGAIITDRENHVLSTGYNGVPSTFKHCTSVPCPGVNDTSGDSSNCLAIHAEANALLQCSDINRAHTIYCTCIPCFTCAKLICNTKIEAVVCLEDYTDHRGLALLAERGCLINVAGKIYNGENTA